MQAQVLISLVIGDWPTPFRSDHLILRLRPPTTLRDELRVLPEADQNPCISHRIIEVEESSRATGGE